MPDPTCVEDSGTFVEFCRSSHADQAPVVTIAVTPTPYHYERKDLTWLFHENTTVPAGLYMTDCKRARSIANWDLVLHRASKNREYHDRHRWTKILLPSHADVTTNTPHTRDKWDRSELPDFDTMYRQWYQAMRSHDMEAAAMFGNSFAAPKDYFGFVGSESKPTTLQDIQRNYDFGTQRAPEAGDASVTATIRP